ncbi:MAG: hypothetical protein LZF85_04645 [Nitrosomonas sp.]|uniref:hypothetical protein n=1 Tax=Nitrosomonas sp. TaxID=42353 RepID=UPI0025D71F05|nr:hypothetical protein [Nitrosomonas sp.]UJP03737.1 MAG: hypothetical protein LZF85_04645 [Nitrosomonas sp.]
MQLSKWTKYLHRHAFIYNGLFVLMWILQTGFLRGELNKFQHALERCWLDRMWQPQSLEMTTMASQFDQYSDEIFAFYGSALWQELADKKGLFLTKSRGFHEGVITAAVWERLRQSSGGGY